MYEDSYFDYIVSDVNIEKTTKCSKKIVSL